MKLKIIFGKPIKFLFVGGLNTFFSFSLYLFLLKLGLDFKVANLFALLTGIVFSYTTNGKYVFNFISKKSLVMYCLYWGIVYFLQLCCIGFAADHGMNYYIGGLISTALTLPITYLIFNKYIFK